MSDAEWAVVVPVKSLASAKSRLSSLGDLRPALALAMASDTVSAASSAHDVAEVFVVTPDSAVAARLERYATSVPDRSRGLSEAFSAGIAAALERWPGCGIALLVGDLPTLRPAEVDVALAHASSGCLVVADAAGTGSTFLASSDPSALRHAFGEGSFARHRALGATPLENPDVDGLRHDVDTPADLDAASLRGLGAATRKVLRKLDGATRR